MNIASIDIKGAYDGVDHEHLFKMIKVWRRDGILTHETVDFIRFLYSQYRLGMTESKNG